MTLKNNPRRAGQPASSPELFGEFSRYSIYPLHTRFERVAWVVADAEREDPETGLPSIVAMGWSREEALLQLKGGRKA